MAETPEEAAARARRVAQYQSQKAGHDHEWTILVSRLTAYLTSQSLFAGGAALLEGTSGKSADHGAAIAFMAVVGTLISILASLSIAINCRVLVKWHVQIQDLIASDKETKYLENMYMPRGQPDWMHRMSTDLFSVTIPLIGGTSWLFILGTHYPALGAPFNLLSLFWYIGICWVYFFSSISKPNQ